jgi:superoxide reductase
MTQLHQVYKCEVGGNIVEVLHTGAGELVCCGQPMKLLVEKSKDEGLEKHLPVITELPANKCQGKDGYKIKVGSTEHPMEEKHWIEWIEIVTQDGKIGKKFLLPDDKPEVEFYTRAEILEVRAYCNLHGLWKVTVN